MKFVIIYVVDSMMIYMEFKQEICNEKLKNP